MQIKFDINFNIFISRTFVFRMFLNLLTLVESMKCTFGFARFYSRVFDEMSFSPGLWFEWAIKQPNQFGNFTGCSQNVYGYIVTEHLFSNTFVFASFNKNKKQFFAQSFSSPFVDPHLSPCSSSPYQILRTDNVFFPFYHNKMNWRLQ